MKGLVKKLFILPVRGYQKFISPLLGTVSYTHLTLPTNSRV